jgi:rubrerythrin
MPEKPSYLGLLNGIAIAECQAHRYLTAWIQVTPNPDVKAVLSKVATREGEHGMSFAKRINELGFEVRQKDDNRRLDEQIAMVSDGRPDIEKMRALGLHRIEEDVLDLFNDVFKDHSIDIRTGELLGRYVAEEHDSARLLRSCYDQLAAAEVAGPAATGQLATLTERVDALCRAVEELRQIVCAQAMPADVR